MPGFAPVGSTPVGALSKGSGSTGAASATLTTTGHGFTISAHGAGSAAAHLTSAAVGRALHATAPGTAAASLTSTGHGHGLRFFAPGTATAHLTSVGVALGIRPTTGTAVASMFASNAIRVPASASDTFSVGDAVTHTGGYAVTVASGIVAHSSVIAALGVVINERVRISLGSLPIWHAQIKVSDNLTLRDSVQQIWRETLAANLAVASTLQVRLVSQILDTITTHSALSAKATYGASLNDDATLADMLIAAFGKHLAETIHFAATQTPLYQAIASLVANVKVTATPSPKWLLAGVVLDDLDLSDITSPQMIFSSMILDLILVDAGELEPSGSLSVWQMNTRTAAVTEYGNYAFNSFARLDTQVYVGASDTGLYELTGDTDEGDPVIAAIRGGYLQFGGTHLSRIKAAYIAVRGAGEFLLKIVTGPGEEYIYSACADTMQSTKFWMGKGQRARYFAYELVSTGQDFDLDTIEFVPIEVQRRV